MTLTLLCATVVQLGTLFLKEADFVAVPAAADIAGYGRLARRWESLNYGDPSERPISIVCLTIARVLYEALPQLEWQSSLIMLQEADFVAVPAAADIAGYGRLAR